MKKIITSILIIATALSFTACSSKPTEKPIKNTSVVSSTIKKEPTYEEVFSNKKNKVKLLTGDKKEIKVTDYVKYPHSYVAPPLFSSKPNKIFTVKDVDEYGMSTDFRSKVWKDNNNFIYYVGEYIGRGGNPSGDTSNIKLKEELSISQYVESLTLSKYYNKEMFPPSRQIEQCEEIAFTNGEKGRVYKYLSVYDAFATTNNSEDYVYTVGYIIRCEDYSLVIGGLDLSKEHKYKDDLGKSLSEIVKTVDCFAK